MTFPNQISTDQANAATVVNEELATLGHQAVYGKKASTTPANSLTWGYYGGRWGGFSVSDGTLSLTASSTNYVVVAIATGVISVSTSATNWNDTDNYARVYKLTTSGSAVTATEDHRAGPGGVHGGSGGGGGSVDLTSDVTGVLPVANGGTGRASHTAYAVLCGGTTSTGAQQSVASVGTSGQVLTSAGAGALPTWQTPATGGDASTNTATSVDGEVALFSGTGGKTLKRATGTGLARLTSGVQSASELSGDVTTSGSNATTIANDAVTNAKLANMAFSTIKGRTTSGTGDPEDLTAAQAAAIVQGDGLTVDLAGFRGIPQNSQSAAYTLVAADAGKHIYHPSGDANARTYTIPANSSVAFPVGTSVTFINETSNVVTIAITTDTLVLAGTGSTGSRSLAQYGVATAVKVTSTRWYISGTGLT